MFYEYIETNKNLLLEFTVLTRISHKFRVVVPISMLCCRLDWSPRPQRTSTSVCWMTRGAMMEAHTRSLEGIGVRHGDYLAIKNPKAMEWIGKENVQMSVGLKLQDLGEKTP